MYEYEATTRCPECHEEETVPVTACVDEETGRWTVLARKVRCYRHDGRHPCDVGRPLGPVTEMRLKDPDAYDYIEEKVRKGFSFAHIGRPTGQP